MMRFLCGSALCVVLVGTVACGSTKVYQNQKTVTHQGDLYNLTAVTKISSRLEATSLDGQTINLRGLDKKQFQQLVSDRASLEATSYIDMDTQHMVYQTSFLKKHSELRRMESNLDSAMSSIQRFMKDKKKRQLDLK